MTRITDPIGVAIAFMGRANVIEFVYESDGSLLDTRLYQRGSLRIAGEDIMLFGDQYLVKECSLILASGPTALTASVYIIQTILAQTPAPSIFKEALAKLRLNPDWDTVARKSIWNEAIEVASKIAQKCMHEDDGKLRVFDKLKDKILAAKTP